MSAENIQGDGFRILVENRGDYLRAHVHDGVDSVQVSIAMWELLAAQCRHHRARRLLVVEDLESSVELEDLQQVIEAMLGFGFADIRIAFVELRTGLQDNEFGEILALERGIVVQVFGNEAVARNWLMHGE